MIFSDSDLRLGRTPPGRPFAFGGFARTVDVGGLLGPRGPAGLQHAESRARAACRRPPRGGQLCRTGVLRSATGCKAPPKSAGVCQRRKFQDGPASSFFQPPLKQGQSRLLGPAALRRVRSSTLFRSSGSRAGFPRRKGPVVPKDAAELSPELGVLNGGEPETVRPQPP